MFGWDGDGQVAVMGAESATGARKTEESAWGGRSLKRKSHHSGRFWFSDPKVRPDPMFGLIAVGFKMGHFVEDRDVNTL